MSDRRRILIVEDDDNVRITLAAFLEKYGYEVLEAGTIDEAYGVMAGNDGPLAAAVLDRYVGQSIGLDLIPELRARYPGIVIAVVSGSAAKAAEADITATKSDSPAVLLNALRQRLQ